MSETEEVHPFHPADKRKRRQQTPLIPPCGGLSPGIKNAWKKEPHYLRARFAGGLHPPFSREETLLPRPVPQTLNLLMRPDRARHRCDQS